MSDGTRDGKEGGSVSDVQRSRKWLVRIKGCDQVSVRPTESLEIGRKPIRPLADTGTPRLEVPDPTRSMSKRHAVLSVGEQGGASVRDLDSTNGTYLVREDGTLIRLPEGVDFPLPSIAVRLQFGDVPVDMIGVDEPDPQPKPAPVADLFDYALGGPAKSEPAAADLSVDDILDLRAGEPTSAFNAAGVASRAAERRLAALRSFPPIRDGLAVPAFDDADDDPIVDSMPLKVGGAADESPRDLFADAMSDASQEPAVLRADAPYLPPALPSVSAMSVASQPVDAPRTDAMPALSDAAGPAAAASFTVSEPVIAPTPSDAVAWGGSAIWHLPGGAGQTGHPAGDDVRATGSPDVVASDEPAASASSDAHGTMPETVGSAGDTRTLPIDRPGTIMGADAGTGGETAMTASDVRSEASDAADAPSTDASVTPADQDADRHVEPVAGPDAAPTAGPDEDRRDAFAVATAVVVDDYATPGVADRTADGSADAVADGTAAPETTDGPRHDVDATPEETVAYAPVFEPGSVFERVARGSLHAPEPTIEVDGLTSDDAKRTNDYTTQFAMARHPQLLPFLAMNPSLYDDLYAWLAAQGNGDIDAALAANPGYREYRDMVGK